MANRNRTAGHNWEIEIVKKLSTLLNLIRYQPKLKNIKDATVGTSRLFSKALDDMKVDIWMKVQFLYIQAKNVKGKVDYLNLLEEMPKDKLRVIIHNYTKKVGKTFRTIGQFAIMPLEDFYKILEVYNKYKDE